MSCERCGGRLIDEAGDKSCLNCGFLVLDLPDASHYNHRARRLVGHRTYPRSRGYGSGKPGICNRCKRGFKSREHRECMAVAV